ncbi:MAG: hypothetical protein BWY32_03333 [bacterium ADurb.Bin243]|nr:MAG: hypothetical protein BWY32_03333 [bacterium ADurb.Bin243]
MWQVDDANNATPAARGTKTGVNLSTLTSDLITAQTIANPKYIAYTITDENGNTSTFANDGQVPVAPVGANITWSDAVSKFKIRNGNVGSADTQLRIYRENIGLYTYLGRAVTLSNADLKGIYGVSEEFAARKTDNTAITVYNNDPVNDKVAYTLVNDNGNESAYDDGGLVPAKPDVTKLAYSKAAKKTIVSAGVVSVDADPGCILYCYQADDASGSGLISKGLKSGVDLTAHFGDLEANQDIAEDKFILYTFKNLAGNTSTYASDGKVPVAPTQAAVSASTFSNASGDIGIKETAFTSLTANTIINVYEDDNGTYDAVNSIKKNWTASADNSGINVTKSATISGGVWTAINVGAKPYVGYSIETADGNESSIIFDTDQIPAAPTLPIASTTLLQAGDGGTDAPAGYVNDTGKAAVTLRPGIALSANEKLTLKVNKTNSAIMTATIVSSAVGNITPVFGTTDANVTFANSIANSGNATTGKFDFTVGGGLSPIAESAGVADVAVTATKTSSNGNESAWSAAVNITYDKTAPTLSFSQAAYVFANDAGVKIFILNASEYVRANSGLGYGTIDPAYGIKTFTVAGWAVPPTQFKFDNFLQGTAVTITSDNSANDTDAGGRIKPAVIQLGTAGIALFKDLAGNKMTNATVTVIFE